MFTFKTNNKHHSEYDTHMVCEDGCLALTYDTIHECHSKKMIVVKKVDVTKPMRNGVGGFLASILMALSILWSIFDIQNSVWSSNALNLFGSFI